MHMILTNRGEAMRLIQSRLREYMGPGRSNWDEPGPTKQVCVPT